MLVKLIAEQQRQIRRLRNQFGKTVKAMAAEKEYIELSVILPRRVCTKGGMLWMPDRHPTPEKARFAATNAMR